MTKLTYKELEERHIKLIGTVRALLRFYISDAIDRLWPGPLGKTMKRLKRLAN